MLPGCKDPLPECVPPSRKNAEQAAASYGVSIEGSLRDDDGVTYYEIKVVDPSGDERSFKRRYSDFDTLHKSFAVGRGESVPVPRMPPKSFFRKRWSPKFRRARQSELDAFIRAAIASDPSLVQPHPLRRFLVEERSELPEKPCANDNVSGEQCDNDMKPGSDDFSGERCEKCGSDSADATKWQWLVEENNRLSRQLKSLLGALESATGPEDPLASATSMREPLLSIASLAQSEVTKMRLLSSPHAGPHVSRPSAESTLIDSALQTRPSAETKVLDGALQTRPSSAGVETAVEETAVAVPPSNPKEERSLRPTRPQASDLVPSPAQAPHSAAITKAASEGDVRALELFASQFKGFDYVMTAQEFAGIDLARLLEGLADLLRAGSSEIQSNAAAALWSLSVITDEIRDAIGATPGALEGFSALLHSQPSKRVSEAVAGAAASVALSESGCAAVYKYPGMLTGFVSVLRSEPTGATAANAASALWSVARRSTYGCNAVSKTPDARLALVAVLREGCPEAKANAAGAIWSLALGPDPMAVASTPGVVEGLASLLDEGTPEGTANAAGAFLTLASLSARDGAADPVSGEVSQRLAELCKPGS